jgi:16S rRNA (cytosine1402-N4)-methyltransferase
MTGHAPVLLKQVVSLVQPERGGLFVDCTVGLGGHAQALLAAGADRLIGLDRDESALAEAGRALAAWGDRVTLRHADYRDLRDVLTSLKVTAVDGILADLGVSSLQLDAAGRGFSFRRDEPLDMRMDRSTMPDAATWLREVEEAELAEVIARFGEERYARRIARAIVGERERRDLTTTGQLAAVVRRALAGRGRQRIDPATRTFQAIRIAVNRELDRLDLFVFEALRWLRTGGRLAIIAFHSLEDRVIKHALRAAQEQREIPVRLVTKKPIVPDQDELSRNRRARSAKLRVAERMS